MRVLQRVLGVVFVTLIGLGLIVVGPSPVLGSVVRELDHGHGELVRVAGVLERVSNGARGPRVAVGSAEHEVSVAEAACASGVGGLVQQLVPQAGSLCRGLGPVASEVAAGGRTLASVEGRVVVFEAEVSSVQRRIATARSWVLRVRVAADLLLALEIAWGVVAGAAWLRGRRAASAGRPVAEAAV